eukprot:CAMPEP_0202462628 /NCGR_PEP_ID=MMETSP1360-20130828/54766_1 /ASSEMBLY_ACC=CAM_ASM_000848 /TAXON_ID=515479 /ORGANISM="Licmophora paradoxa, Strain CCMP2313" /LENGTH=61 /DNA_ID=CAMNT_0049085177 /DNA_START=45 /DNA_END=227 /DNA_ORIENTATION=-
MSLPVSYAESALFDKFNKLQTAINATREKQKVLDEEKDALNTKIGDLRHLRDEMEALIQRR